MRGIEWVHCEWFRLHFMVTWIFVRVCLIIACGCWYALMYWVVMFGSCRWLLRCFCPWARVILHEQFILYSVEGFLFLSVLLLFVISTAVLGRVLRGSVELPLAGVHFFPMRTNICLFMCLNSVRARRSGPQVEAVRCHAGQGIRWYCFLVSCWVSLLSLQWCCIVWFLCLKWTHGLTNKVY
jgi:hypothetical protein